MDIKLQFTASKILPPILNSVSVKCERQT